MNEEKPVLLVVLAHPDDETFGMGGTLAMYARCGVNVHLVCATRGEAGEMEPEYLEGYANIADRRVAELRCAAGLLGITAVHFLNYRDSGMPGSLANEHPRALVGQPIDQVTEDIVHYIRKLRPHVVVTFDPIGGYRHPDHIAIHQATVRAFYAAGDPQQFPSELGAHTPQRLFFHVIPHTFLRLAVRTMPLFGKDPRRFGKNADIDLASLVEVRFPTHTVINFLPVAGIRDEASACHASQGGGRIFPSIINRIRYLFSSTENFMQAHPQRAGGRISHDLFDGVQINGGSRSVIRQFKHALPTSGPAPEDSIS